MNKSRNAVYLLFFLTDLVFIPIGEILGVPSRLSLIIFILLLTIFSILMRQKISLNYVALLEIATVLALIFILLRLWQSTEVFISFLYLIVLPGLFLTVNYKISPQSYSKFIAVFCIVASTFFILLPSHDHEGIRILIGTDNNIWFGRLLGLTALCIMFLFGDRSNSIVFFITPITLYILYETDARGALISFMIATLAYRFISSRKIFIYLAMCFPLVVLSLPLLVGDFLEAQNDFSNLERLRIYIFALNGIIDSPIVGHGLGSFQNKYWDEAVKYPHNIFLELSYEYGLLVTFLFIFLIIKLSVFSNKTDFTLLVYFLINASFSGNIFGNFQLIIIMLSIIKNRRNESCRT